MSHPAHKPAFLITIDTEGDNLWEKPRQASTRNAEWLPRFQHLCEEFDLKPTYLTDFRMARCPKFREFARGVLRRNAGEIGMHLHAWDCPPAYDLTGQDHLHCPYLIEYPPEVMRSKIAALTSLLEDTFEVKMSSHRAGRWAFDGAYARDLIASGYLVDCSVTPHVSWKSEVGAPGGSGGSDYTSAWSEPYFLDLQNVCRPGPSTLLEVPVSIMPVSPRAVDTIRCGLGRRSPARRVLNRLWPPLTWLRPNGRNRNLMLRLARKAIGEHRAHLEFILHSSEFMPGGSPTFPDAAAIEALYGDLRSLFAAVRDTCEPLALSEFARRHLRRNPGG